MYVDDELIENLRVALDLSEKQRSHVELRQVAREILRQPGLPEGTTRVEDRNGDVWSLREDGNWSDGSSYVYPLEYIRSDYGPLKPVN